MPFKDFAGFEYGESADSFDSSEEVSEICPIMKDGERMLLRAGPMANGSRNERWTAQ